MGLKETLRRNEKLVLKVILLLVFFSIFLMVPGIIVTLDYWPNCALSYNIATEHTFYLDNFLFVYENTSSQNLSYFDYPQFEIQWGDGPWYFRKVGGHLVSTYPPTIPLLGAPVYFIANIFVPGDLFSGSDLKAYILAVGKINGAFLTTISVLIVWLFLNATKSKHADALVLIYGCATLVLPSTHSLNNHVGGLIFLPLAWLFAYKSIKNPKDIGYAGLFAALAYTARPTNIASLGILLLYSIFTKKDWKRFVIFALIPLFFLWSYNYFIFGSPFTSGYGILFFKLDTGEPASFFDLFYINPINITQNLAANLFSPNRGIFMFSPILLFSLPGMFIALKEKKLDFYKWVFAALILTLLILSSWKLWTGGLRYGYTMALDTIPYFIFFISIYADKIFSNKFLFYVFVFLAIISFLIAIVGITYGCDWSSQPVCIDLAQERAWDFNDLQILRCFS